jgi:hypothetical protein
MKIKLHFKILFKNGVIRKTSVGKVEKEKKEELINFFYDNLGQATGSARIGKLYVNWNEVVAFEVK